MKGLNLGTCVSYSIPRFAEVLQATAFSRTVQMNLKRSRHAKNISKADQKHSMNSIGKFGGYMSIRENGKKRGLDIKHGGDPFTKSTRWNTNFVLQL